MEKEKRNKQIHLRLTEAELKSLKEKSEGYPSMSAFILDACDKFDDELGRKRIARLRQFSEDFQKFEYDINRIGNNMNQLAHYANRLKQMNLLNHNIIAHQEKLFDEVKGLYLEILQSNLCLRFESKKVLKFK